MFRFLTVFFSFIILMSCTGQSKEDAALSEPPYDKKKESIRNTPDNADLYYRRAGLLYSNNQQNFAEADLRKAWQLNPKEEYALSLVTILKQKNTDSAIQFIQGALKKLPESIALRIGLARGYQQKNDLPKAMQICDEIIASYPNELDALILKSDILKSLNREPESLAILEQAHYLAPLDKDLAYDLAYEYADTKNPKAIALSDTLIKRDNTETVARAFYVKATYYNNAGNNKEALSNYDSAITHDYNFLDAYLDKGKLQYNNNQYADAAKTFQLALRIAPATPDFYFWLGKVQQASGNRSEAKLNYQRAYGLDKSMTQAKEAADKL
jgi:tetratricopeptide (TPR) repeat protein